LQTPTIRADVNLVQVHVKVTDSHGRNVTGLDKKAFDLLVDNARQDITVFQGEDVPVAAGIVIDNSASMAPKRKDVIAAATDFAHDSNPRDEMFVLHFNDKVRLGLPANRPFTSDIDDLKDAISKFELGGTTAFYDAMLSAMTHLNDAAYNSRVLLAITDGGDNSSSATPRDVIGAAGKNGTLIFAVGIFDNDDPDRNPEVLKELAESTGGGAFFPKSSAELPGMCRQIAREIRHEYTLGFAGATDGRYHSIQVLVNDPIRGRLQAHARSGYQAAGKTE
jgi:VWFA-related protein